jgi:hypothetical protein
MPHRWSLTVIDASDPGVFSDADGGIALSVGMLTRYVDVGRPLGFRPSCLVGDRALSRVAEFVPVSTLTVTIGPGSTKEIEVQIMGRVGLAKALRLLREELATAQEEGQDHQFRFEITGADVEFLVEIDSEGGLEGKAGFGVVSVGAGSKVSRADTHRLRLKLNVKDAATGGRNLEVRRDEARSWDE